MSKLNGIFFEPPAENNFLGHIFEEVYKSGLYQPFIPQNPKGKTVLDIGGNIGITSYFFHDKFENVYTMEPSPDHFKTLTYMLDFNKIDNVHPFQIAVSNTDGKSAFFHYNNRTMDSLYGNLQGPGLQMTGSEEVELKRLDTFFEENKIEHLDLMKIDCEGVEFEVLCGDGFSNVAHKIDAIVGEIHSFSGRQPNQIKDALENLGYAVQFLPHDATLFYAKR